MELNDTLRVPLAPAVVRDALEDLALLRASFDHCESFAKLAHGEFALTITVPLGPLRARYDVRAHSASEQDDARRVISFKARADGLGALRGQVELALLPGDDATTTQIDYVVWATASGPLAELPGRQIERALHQWTDDFFHEFGAVVQAKHGLVPNRAASSAPRRQHVFLRPASLMAAAKRPLPHLGGALSGRAASAVQPRASGPLPLWAWAAIILFVAVLLYAARWINGG
ncbi:CoxG family protein [Burkholderia vietnamiensis]|jgi:carbon monoxide dehydrogenase subunit G|uniref:CoxG family protein n=1 Tax=Burkholderia vietnamiensis TaxID=60552 RepID=UPI00075BA018|nr:SRPBCC domain-containing protein [Burkholderia vietnamiensis]AOK01117.1 carbon monoxide dehydrogenase [Burkholderia vietnamiensis]KVF05671.1 carbon monoxide dehydrogenase [Burkholderia vietnamiensis]KVF07042.1 carbon monoxide dehydrogenase [Burkholderia vietnamiensis]MCA8194611.1 carbon monoxide dehydrogenase [Burkholderia vietnamiensis]QTK84088.1 carbon monoxide dehydrogenase [Burkholderia vietnamiensis]